MVCSIVQCENEEHLNFAKKENEYVNEQNKEADTVFTFES